jgi:hypothetical protein
MLMCCFDLLTELEGLKWKDVVLFLLLLRLVVAYKSLDLGSLEVLECALLL